MWVDVFKVILIFITAFLCCWYFLHSEQPCHPSSLQPFLLALSLSFPFSGRPYLSIIPSHLLVVTSYLKQSSISLDWYFFSLWTFPLSHLCAVLCLTLNATLHRYILLLKYCSLYFAYSQYQRLCPWHTPIGPIYHFRELQSVLEYLLIWPFQIKVK